MPTPVAPAKTPVRVSHKARAKVPARTPTRGGSGWTSNVYVTIEIEELLVTEFGQIVGTAP